MTWLALTILALVTLVTFLSLGRNLAWSLARGLGRDRSLLVFHDLRLLRAAWDQRVVAAAILPVLLIAWTTALLVVVRVDGLLDALVLLGSLRHRIENAEVMLGVLEVALRHDTIPGTGRIAPELEIFLEKLLCRAAHAQIRPIAIEHMIAVERDLTVMMTYRSATAAAATTAATTARTMVAASHTFHVHQSVAALS